MNDRDLAHYDPDEATLAADDRLLDALGRGESPPADDPFLLALSMWREDLTRVDQPEAVTAAARRRPGRRKARWGVISAAVAALIGGGVTVAAAASTAEPGSPLWPITERVFVEQASTASVEAVEVTVEDARTAVREQRLDEAEHLLDEAEKLLANVIEVTERLELERQIAQVRELLAGALGGLVPAPATTTPPGATPTPAPSGGAPTPSPSPSKDGGLLPLPLPSILPLPSLPLL